MCRESELNQTMISQNEGGFNVRNKDSISQSYICSKCTLLLKDPVQMACGHRYCQSCLNISDHSILKCIKCQAETAGDKIIFDRGCQRDMESLHIGCSSCDWEGLFKDYSDHLTTHQSEYENETITCELRQYGCTEKFLRKDIQKHLLSNKHQETMLQLLKSSTSTILVPSDNLMKTVDVLFSSMQVLTDDMQVLNSKVSEVQSTMESITANVSHLKLAVEETSVLVKGLEPNQQILRQNISSLTQEIEDQIVASYDGTLLWKVTDVQQKMSDAQSEKHPSIYSPPFYSSPNGYKMRARLYFHGDGTARRTHLSVFFVLMRGKYDSILVFPFNYKVTFCLYDQSGQQRHIIDSFRPDIKSVSFQRPCADMNIASGIPKFMPLDRLQQSNNSYICNDTMFIKIMVHFQDTPKTLLPSIFNMNPGVPDEIQEFILKQQIEKQTQPSATSSNADT